MIEESRALSSLLTRGDMISVMGDDLGSLLPNHKDVWEFIWDYYKINKQTPPPSIVKENFADFQYDSTLEGSTKYYVKTLQEYMAKNQLEQVILGATKALQSGKVPAEELLNHFSKRVSEIQRQTGVARSVDVRDTDDAMKHYDKVRELSALHDGRPGIAFGFDIMDEYYPTGMAPGHFIVLMGYSGKGKTWFGIKLMINAWLQGYSPLIVNLEMTPEELRDRIYFLISEYTMDDLVRANIDPDNFKAWAKDFMKDRPEFNLIGNETFGDFSVDMVQAKVEQYNPDVILLDYLGLFSDRGRSNSEIERAKRTARELKQLGAVMKIPVVAITAVTGKDKKDRVNPPEVAQVAFSSEIEYAANLALAVHTHINPDTQEAMNTEIVFRKNRHGPLCNFFVKMDLNKGTILEIDPADQMEFLDSPDDPTAEF